MRNRETHLAGDNVGNEIKNLKPYDGGNQELSGLHALDIADKHKLALPVAATAALSAESFNEMSPGRACQPC
jgi:hypothetical protein